MNSKFIKFSICNYLSIVKYFVDPLFMKIEISLAGKKHKNPKLGSANYKTKVYLAGIIPFWDGFWHI